MRTKIACTPGGALNNVPRLSSTKGFVSPSVKTTINRFCAVGAKKLSLATRAIEPSVVIRVLNPSVGGGRSIPIAR